MSRRHKVAMTSRSFTALTPPPMAEWLKSRALFFYVTSALQVFADTFLLLLLPIYRFRFSRQTSPPVKDANRLAKDITVRGADTADRERFSPERFSFTRTRHLFQQKQQKLLLPDVADFCHIAGCQLYDYPRGIFHQKSSEIHHFCGETYFRMPRQRPHAAHALSNLPSHLRAVYMI